MKNYYNQTKQKPTIRKFKGIFTLLLFLGLLLTGMPTVYAQDTDGDGVADSVDLDDDNDGILDTDECTTVSAASNEIVD